MPAMPRNITRRAVLLSAAAATAAPLRRSHAALAPNATARILDGAQALPRVHGLIIGQAGEQLLAEAVRGPALDRAVNVKSLSKSVLSALVGIAFDRGVLTSVDQPVAALLPDQLPPSPDPRLSGLTVGHLLSMRAGLERTSGPNYGRWVTSDDWVGYALSRPFVDDPGGRMLYSTGSYHLLSAILTRATGISTLALARDWLGKPLGIEIPPWTKDPQGIYMGGNNMALSPLALYRFAEVYRQGGTWRDDRVVPRSWVDASWQPRTESPFTGHAYGYGWFIASARRPGGRRLTVNYGWGFGGQMVYVVPDLDLSVVITSDPDAGPAGRTGYVGRLHGLLARTIIPAVS